ncbi:peptide/nickel transport system substrate-binding protein [Humitalea rosea]|uniref:Peptide/nickel transport system substrate-binding protein n=1 Tax=Humitalea rosea TaxID=990373 RepID=A0A2W7IT32_9PROT|nr:ABC transporter substrate-binding protein [Humitalea rosea]PZW50409.1 peptide/nickel transport system substrate-binding protein [Humitalea rosea]
MRLLPTLALALGLLPQITGAQIAGAQTLTMGVQSTFGVDPHFLFLGPNMAAARHIYDSLIGRDPESRWVPGLAESWEAEGDNAWVLHLKHDVLFQDGSPFTAADVAFSLARIPNVPNNPGPYTPNLRTITGVEVVDPYTIRLTTDRPNPTLPGQLTNVFIVSAKAAEGATTADFASGRAAIGTGPFRLVAFRGAEGMSLTRNESWHGGRAPWEKVEVRVMSNDASRLAALLSGDVDLVEEISPSDVERLERDPRVSVFKRPSDRVMFLLPLVGPERVALITDTAGQPLDRNPLRDLKVRQAISLALDRGALVSRAMDGQAVATAQLVPEGFGAWDPNLPAARPDPAAARRLLAEAGYPQGFGLTIGCSNNRYVNDSRICQAAGQMLSRAGLKVSVETQPGSVFFPRTVAGRNDVPLILFGLSLSSSRDASYLLATVMHTQNRAMGIGQGNRGGFSDPELDAMIENSAVMSGPEREPALRAAMLAGIARGAAIPLYNQVTIAAARRGITYTPRMDEQMVATYASPAP